ncbi:MAG: 3-keto-disaccharide hydrolase [Pirellulales bacterium]
MKRTTLIAIGLLFSMALAARAEDGFVSLFDGKTLNGWKKAGGGATYRVEDGTIVGRVGPGPNTFLCTEKTYGDFIFKVEVKLDVPSNSGIQFRSHKRTAGDRVFGYQAEIDPSARAWSGGIYDEGRRGWLYSLEGHPEAQKAFKVNDWNAYVIKAVGPSLTISVNGVPCADLIDTTDLEGFLALQVHAAKEGQIRWRNILLKDLGTSKWQPLWNGKNLEGWEKIGGGDWKVEGGTIHGTSAASEGRHGHLITKKEYGDFALRVKYKANRGNSGLYFRVDREGAGDVKGFQAEIDPTKDAGGLYETGGRAWVVQPKPEQVKTWYKPNAWNEMSVVAIGKRIVVSVNGKQTAELKNDPGRTRGFIALQLHGGQDMDVLFKDIEILPIAAEGR